MIIIALSIVLILVFLLMLQSRKKTKEITPGLFIFIWFSSFAFLSQIGIYGMEKAYLYSTLFIVVNIGIIAILSSIGSPAVENYNSISQKYSDGEKDKQLTKYIRIIIFSLNLIIFINLLYRIIQGSFNFDAIRDITYKSGKYDETYKLIYFNDFFFSIYNNIFRGYIVFDFGYSICRLFSGKGKLPILSVLNICMFCVVQLSRIEIARSIIIVIFAATYTGKIKHQIQRILKSRGLRIVFLIAIGFIVWVVFLRNYSKESFFSEAMKNIIGDATGPYIAFSYSWNDYWNNSVIVPGLLSFCESLLGGFSSAFIAIINMLFGSSLVSSNTLVNNYTGGKILDIGIGYSFNAFYTMYCPPLLTGGVFGCLIFSLLIGILLSSQYKKKNNNEYELWKFVYLMMLVIMGIFNYQLQSIASWVTLGLTLFNRRCSTRRRSVPMPYEQN